eukprot:1249359-Pyramimonas_sp.AAC.1
MGAECGRSHWGLRWRSLRGYEKCKKCAEIWLWGRHAGAANLAFGGTPYGATKRVRVCRHELRGGTRA